MWIFEVAARGGFPKGLHRGACCELLHGEYFKMVVLLLDQASNSVVKIAYVGSLTLYIAILTTDKLRVWMHLHKNVVFIKWWL
jgi:hypothetical protein